MIIVVKFAAVSRMKRATKIVKNIKKQEEYGKNYCTGGHEQVSWRYFQAEPTLY